MTTATVAHVEQIAQLLGVEAHEIMALGNPQPSTEADTSAARLRRIAAELLAEADRMEQKMADPPRSQPPVNRVY
ncbi:hypothetical protein [Nesterenkonia marinintestina]|uniref:hypothetical protein n=1 Tax=Nesterenkonia marinintestina TaxID=2979865 RepID=UPI0021BEB4EC|nr:hypothetical protein [Nesterenkonia sp. GX14115]